LNIYLASYKKEFYLITKQVREVNELWVTLHVFVHILTWVLFVKPCPDIVKLKPPPIDP
jgi:hypothetical protein